MASSRLAVAVVVVAGLAAVAWLASTGGSPTSSSDSSATPSAAALASVPPRLNESPTASLALVPTPETATAPPPSPAGSAPPSLARDLQIGKPFANTVIGGSTYHSVGFITPFALTIPSGFFDPRGQPRTTGTGVATALNWPPGELTITCVSHAARFTYPEPCIVPSIKFVNDAPIGVTSCVRTTAMADNLATPAAAVAWLREWPGFQVSEPRRLKVDGRTALVVDVVDLPDNVCQVDSAYFQRREFVRVYAVPTGSDTMLVVAPISPRWQDRERPRLDDLVRSLDFR